MSEQSSRQTRSLRPLGARVTRREAFELAALGLLVLSGDRAAAQQKAPKDAVRYQSTPMDDQQCSGCIHFMPGADPSGPGTCAVVEGEIDPEGWCAVFTPKA